MSQTSDFIKRVAERTGYRREFFMEKNMPSTPSNVVIMSFYGDIRSAAIMSSLLLRQFKEKSGKYLILCSWPGFQGLFPYVDEFWSLDDKTAINGLVSEAGNFNNTSRIYTELNHTLMESVNLLTVRDFKEYYDFGYTSKYFDEFKDVKRHFSEIVSETKLSANFLNELAKKKGIKVFIYPTTKMWCWQKNKSMNLPVPKLFWETLIEELINEGFSPIIYQNWFTYDMSKDFAQRCTYLVPTNITDVMAAMRSIGLVLDVFSGISTLSMVSRTPFVVVDERQRYIGNKGYEVDDLCCVSPKQHIWSFATMLMNGTPEEWKNSLIDAIIVKLKDFYPKLGNKNWGSTNESYETISYDIVRKRKMKRLGVYFINPSAKPVHQNVGGRLNLTE
jgi:hypothetical protein